MASQPLLIPPSLKYKQSYLEALQEFWAEGIYYIDNTDLCSLEKNFETAVIQKFKDYSEGKNLPEGYVPDTTLWLIDGDEFIGRISIRHRLSEKLKTFGGHIGYDICPSRRRQGYGKMLALALPIARKLGIQKALLTCDDDNIASQKVIESNGGMLQDKVLNEGKKVLTRRYWIEL